MSLHEALSTGLSVYDPSGRIIWEERVYTKLEVLLDTWQVRLPDGAITDSYSLAEQALIQQAGFTGIAKASNISLPISDEEVIEAQRKMLYPNDTTGPHTAFNRDNAGRITKISECECGSEAIGGGSAHSNWCPRSQAGK